jgi:hypothetical protein
MATLADPADIVSRERRFFFVMACVMALVIVAGFSSNLLLGRSSFNVPLVYHAHAFVFFGWATLYVLQNGLVAAGNVALHRRLGVLAVAWLPAMVVLGTAMTVLSVRKDAPFFFDVHEFLVGNVLGILAFATLATAAILMRARPDWHRRLMFCSMAILTGPGLGRLLPMPLFIPWAWWAAILVSLIFPLIGMAADRRRTGRVHPAWHWGLGAIVGSLLLGDLIAYSAIGTEATQSIIAGTPGADRPLQAFLP